MIAEVTRVLLSLVAALAGLLSVVGFVFHFQVGPAHGAGLEFGILGGLIAIGMSIVVMRWSAYDDRRSRSTERARER